MRNRISAAVLLSAFAMACGGGPDNPDAGPTRTQVEPSTVEGTVWGEIIDALTETPLADATVTLSIGTESVEATSNADGIFSFPNVPAGGQAGVTVKVDGYTQATIGVTIPGSTGNFPTEGIGAFVGPVGLFPTTGAFDVQVIGFDGEAIEGANIQASVPARWVNFASGVGIPVGNSVVNTTVSGGIASFSGLPSLAALSVYNANISTIIDPVDADGDGIVDYAGVRDTRPASTIQTQGRFTLTMGPSGGNTPLNVIATNIGSLLDGQGRPSAGNSVAALTGPFRVVYNQPLNAATLAVTLFGNEGKSLVDSTAVLDQGNVVTITPDSDLTAGHEYHLLVEVVSAGTTSGTTSSRVFGALYGEPPAAEVTIDDFDIQDRSTANVLDPGDIVHIELSQAIGLGEGKTAGAIRFPIYFNVDMNNSGTQGDAVGEWLGDQPIWANGEEPPPNAPFTSAGYTRFFQFTMPNVTDVNTGLPYNYQPNTTLPVIPNFGGTESGYTRLTDPNGLPMSTPSGSNTLQVNFN